MHVGKTYPYALEWRMLMPFHVWPNNVAKAYRVESQLIGAGVPVVKFDVFDDVALPVHWDASGLISLTTSGHTYLGHVYTYQYTFDLADMNAQRGGAMRVFRDGVQVMPTKVYPITSTHFATWNTRWTASDPGWPWPILGGDQLTVWFRAIAW